MNTQHSNTNKNIEKAKALLNKVIAYHKRQPYVGKVFSSYPLMNGR